MKMQAITSQQITRHVTYTTGDYRTDTQGRILELLDGPKIPEWGGVGNKPDDYAGQTGVGYAKILEELWTQVSPTVAYWN